MYSYNRRQYINKEPEKKIEKNIPESNENTDINNLVSSNVENIKLLLESVDEIKKSVKKLEESIGDIASRLVNWENNFYTDNNVRNVQSQYDSKIINNQLNTPKNNVQNNKPLYQKEENIDVPMMPGACFSNITAEYLKNLSKNR